PSSSSPAPARTAGRTGRVRRRAGRAEVLGSGVAPGTVGATAAWASPGRRPPGRRRPRAGGAAAAAGGPARGRRPPARRGPRAWEVVVMSVVTEHLEQRGAAFDVLPHRQAYSSIAQGRAL